MRIGIVGGGLAGTLLAWRLCRTASVDLITGAPVPVDATGASGGLVRGFDRGPATAALATESLVELRADQTLRELAGYREIGSVFLLPPGTDPTESVRVIDERLPGSATVVTGTALDAYPFRELPAGAVAVVERFAGQLSPARLRTAALELVDGTIRTTPVTTVTEAGVRLADGSTHRYDAVVVAAGAWTPTLLAGTALRTKQIQYSVYEAELDGLGVFDDTISGLYGLPAGESRFLLGLPCDRWDIDPADVRPDLALVDRVADTARKLLGIELDRPIRMVAAFDCYSDPPGLALRPTSFPSVFTFTGGSGGAAKTALAASRLAAAELLT
ncbi:MAG TPA: FAD-dependent oxidoreductase [Pseudonocardiaceae bacterium]|nr:FAD-dependent oxidoreductase [Pseudonocardiaceae bacterium]